MMRFPTSVGLLKLEVAVALREEAGVFGGRADESRAGASEAACEVACDV